MKLSDAVEQYLTHKRDERRLSPDSMISYTYVTRKFLRFFGEDSEVETLTPERMKDWFTQIASPNAEGHSHRPRSVRMWWCIGKNFAKWLARNNYLPAAPLPEVDLPSLDAPHRPRVNDVEIQIVLDSIEAQPNAYRRALHRAIVHTMISTAMRVIEITQAKLCDLHLSENFLHIPHGKGDKSRSAPLNDEALAALRLYLEVRPKSENDRLFLHSEKRQFCREGMRRLLKQVATDAGFEGADVSRFLPHAVRRRGLDNAYRQTKDIRVAQALAGHTSALTTEAYLASNEQDVIEQRNITRLHPTGAEPQIVAPPAVAVPIVPAPLSPGSPEFQTLTAQFMQMLLAMQAMQGVPPAAPPQTPITPEPAPPAAPAPRSRKRTNLRRPY